MLLLFMYLSSVACTLGRRRGREPPVMAALGDLASLACPLALAPGSVVVWSTSRGRVLFAGSMRVCKDPRLSSESGVLHITDVQEGDGQEYQCQVEDKDGVRMGRVVLEVQSPALASILGAGEVVTVREGASLALRCRGRGTPLPLVSWHRAGHTSAPLAQGRGEVGLLLESLTREDQGTLLCRADNGVGQAAEDKLLLDVLYAPQVELLPPSMTESPCGLQLQCMVHSSAPARVSWYRDSHLLLPSSPGVTMWSLDSLHVLQLHVCDLSLVAEFSCRAESSLGRAESSLRVTRDQLERQLARKAQQRMRQTSNNVRRNVDAQALVSSSQYFSSSSLLLLFVAVSLLLIS